MKILLLLVAQSPGGLEKRFYNYFKYIMNKNDNNYTAILSKSLAYTLGDIPTNYENRIIKYGMNWKYKNVVTRYIDYICLVIVLIFLLNTYFDVVHYVTGSSTFFKTLIRSKRNVYSLVLSVKEPLRQLLKSKLFQKLIFNDFRIDCLDENIYNMAIEYYPEKQSNCFFSPCSFIDYSDTSITKKENVICFAGRLENFKGIQLLLDIILEVCNNTDFNIRIFGKGSYSREITNLIDKYNLCDRVYLGYTVNIKEELSKSKIFLSLQKDENYPSQSLIEAMACGNVIIATNVGLTSQLVKEDFGVLIPFNSKDLLDAIVQTTANVDKLAALGKKTRNFVLQNHTIERFDKYLQVVYQS